MYIWGSTFRCIPLFCISYKEQQSYFPSIAEMFQYWNVFSELNRFSKQMPGINWGKSLFLMKVILVHICALPRCLPLCDSRAPARQVHCECMLPVEKWSSLKCEVGLVVWVLLLEFSPWRVKVWSEWNFKICMDCWRFECHRTQNYSDDFNC